MSVDLQQRVEKFMRLQLPGQPQMMHTGSSNLVNDLWREVQKLRKDYEALDAAYAALWKKT